MAERFSPSSAAPTLLVLFVVAVAPPLRVPFGLFASARLPLRSIPWFAQIGTNVAYGRSKSCRVFTLRASTIRFLPFWKRAPRGRFMITVVCTFLAGTMQVYFLALLSICFILETLHLSGRVNCTNTATALIIDSPD